MAATEKEHLKLFLRRNKEVSGEDGFISSSDTRNGICPTRIGNTNTDFFSVHLGIDSAVGLHFFGSLLVLSDIALASRGFLSNA